MEESTNELLKDLKTVTIVFDENTSHTEVIRQFVDKMHKVRKCPRKEIIEHLEMTSLLLKDYKINDN